MNKKGFVAFLLPLLIAIGLLTLPKMQNLSIRNHLAEKTLAFSRWLSHTPSNEETANATLPLKQWLKAREVQLTQTEQRARKLAPFSTTSENSCKSFVIANVLFRNVNSWNSSFWINKGSDDSLLICKNSPVLSGDSVIGVIDYVGKKASCVRLITDSSVTPAVRVARNVSDRTVSAALATILEALEDGRLPSSGDAERERLVQLIKHLAATQEKQNEPLMLAKGILQGHGNPLWQAQNNLLKGIGFNYDFKDQYSEGHDLRPSERNPDEPPLVKVGDLLVTSGMDGVFPEGLKIATVESIMPLTEGAYAYELYATPTAKDILDLHFVTILPPQGFEESLLPTNLERILDQLD